jgi:hypothetical protein
VEDSSFRLRAWVGVEERGVNAERHLFRSSGWSARTSPCRARAVASACDHNGCPPEAGPHDYVLVGTPQPFLPVVAIASQRMYWRAPEQGALRAAEDHFGTDFCRVEGRPNCSRVLFGIAGTVTASPSTLPSSSRPSSVVRVT